MGESGHGSYRLIMKWFFIALPLLALSLFCFAQPKDSKLPVEKQNPRYVAEAPLPKGWPKPGPYNEVTLKTFPAYRAAYTQGKGSGFAFWRLFRHIKRQGIPMTSPVEIGMAQKEQKLGMESMGFLYQHDEVGKLGQDGRKIEVRDVAAMKALSYTWQGDKNKTTLQKAKLALDTVSKKRGVKSDDYRVMGYNGPRVSKDQKTWEMLLVLPAKEEPQP